MACMLALVAVTGLPVAATVCAAVCANPSTNTAGHHGRHAVQSHQASASTANGTCHRFGAAGERQLRAPSHDCAKHDEAAVEARSAASRADDGVGVQYAALVPAFLQPPALDRPAGARSDGWSFESPARPLGAGGQLILRI